MAKQLKAAIIVGKATAKAKGAAKAKAKATCKAKATATTKSLKKTDREQQMLLAEAEDGMNIQEKMKMLRDSKPATVTEAVAKAKLIMTKLDHSKLWGRAQTAMKDDSALKTAYEAADSKTGRGNVIMAWCVDPNKSGIFKTLTSSVTAGRKLEKTEEWISWTEMSTRWTDDEITAHIHSGRIIERESSTPGVFEYYDQKKMRLTHTVDKSKTLAGKQETELGDEETEQFQLLFDNVVLGLTDKAFELGDYAWSETTARSKGGGKVGKGGLQLAKAAAKSSAGKGGKAAAKAVEEDPQKPQPDQKDPAEVAMAKGKQCLAILDKKIVALEEDMAQVKKTKYWNKNLHTEFKDLLIKLEGSKTTLKKAVVSEGPKKNLEGFKLMLATACISIQACSEFVKEHKAFSSKASVAPSEA